MQSVSLRTAYTSTRLPNRVDEDDDTLYPVVYALSSRSPSPIDSDCAEPMDFSINCPADYRANQHGIKSASPRTIIIGTEKSTSPDGWVNCGQCNTSFEHSLEAWMDHLCDYHPLPEEWSSTRALVMDDVHPYTAVVCSHKKRKSNAVPRPLNSFMVFAQYIRRATLRWFPEAHNVRISQHVGSVWRNLDERIREQYAREAVRLQRLHAIEFPDYKYQPKKRIRPESPMQQRSDKGARANPGIHSPRHQKTTAHAARVTCTDDIKGSVKSGYNNNAAGLDEIKPKVDLPSSRGTPKDDTLTVLVSHNDLPAYRHRIYPRLPHPTNPTTTDFPAQSIGYNQNTMEDLFTTPSMFANTVCGSVLTEPLRVITQPIYCSPVSNTDYDSNKTPQCSDSLHQDSMSQKDASEMSHTNWTSSVPSFSPDSTDLDGNPLSRKTSSSPHPSENDGDIHRLEPVIHCQAAYTRAVDSNVLESSTTCWTLSDVKLKTASSGINRRNLVSSLSSSSVGFENIETNGPGPSLDELSHLILFDSKGPQLTESHYDSLTHMSRSSIDSNPINSKFKIDNPVQSSIDSLARLPSIESWVHMATASPTTI